MANPVKTAKAMNQNQRKMKIFSFRMLTGRMHIASITWIVPEGP
jgi:hypothetical protein